MSDQTRTIDLTPTLRSAAELMAENGWAQGTLGSPTGPVCMEGAVTYCNAQPGDGHLVRQVLIRRDRAAHWNDEPDRTAYECVEYLRTAHITDDDLATTYGPQWRGIVALVRRAAVLAPDEVERLAAAWDAAWAGVSTAAARGAAGDAARAADLDAARAAAGAAAWDAAWGARGAAWDAARALVTRDLIGTHGYAQDHYDALTRSWATVIGPVHPDDQTPGDTNNENGDRA